jgi:site-specific recombinase XerD
MSRSTFKQPKWETQVNQTIQRLKKKNKSRSLKSSNIYECACIFVESLLKKRKLEKITISRYFRHLKLFSSWLSETEKLTDIEKVNPTIIQKYFLFLENEKKHKKSSLASTVTSLWLFFHSMKSKFLIEDNPCNDFNISPKPCTKIEKILSPFEITILLRSVKNHYQYLENKGKLNCLSLFIHRRDLCILSLSIACGLRNVEIRRLKIEHIDLDKKTILISGKGNQKVVIKERIAFFSNQFLEKIVTRYYHMRKKLPGSNFFSNCYGDELSQQAVGYIFSKYNSFISKNAHCTSTMTRKSFASHLVKKRVNIEAIRNLLGHEDCETTLKYYVHIDPDQLKSTWKETNPYAD